MKKWIVVFMVFLFCSGLMVMGEEKKAKPQIPPAPMMTGNSDQLAVLWTSGDPEVAKKMVFIYTYNAKKYQWFKQIRLIVWGASTKLLSKDKELQEWIGKMKKEGVELYACKWCSDSYGVSDQLTKMGIKVIYYGKPLTEMIKSGWNILTF